MVVNLKEKHGFARLAEILAETTEESEVVSMLVCWTLGNIVQYGMRVKQERQQNNKKII